MQNVTRRLSIRTPPSAFVGIGILVLLFVRGSNQPASDVIGKAIGLSVLVFATVLIHELGHAGVALAMGLAPVEIRINSMGGTTSYARHQPRPGIEAAIAAAGPAATVVLALIATAGAHLTTGAAHSTMTFWRDACIILTVFNLLPGLPLDGGALVKSAIWAVNGDERRAVRAAAAVGLLLTATLAGVAVLGLVRHGDRVLILITAVLAGSIGIGAYQSWQDAAPAGSARRPSILEADLRQPPPTEVPPETPPGESVAE